MRARYTAYVVHDAAFLLATWHPDTRPSTVRFDRDLEWLELRIVDVQGGAAFDNEGSVQFQARFRRGGEQLQLDELSRFVRKDGAWMYVEGV